MVEMILGEQENVFLFEFGPIVPAVLKCLFRLKLLLFRLHRRFIFDNRLTGEA